MESLKYIITGFLLGFAITYFVQAHHSAKLALEQVSYVDKEMHDDQEIDKAILVEPVSYTHLTLPTILRV